MHVDICGLENVGIVLDRRGFIDTDRGKTEVPAIWAIGDVTHGPMLTHKAEDEAIACVELIAGQAGHVNYDIIPYLRGPTGVLRERQSVFKAA